MSGGDPAIEVDFDYVGTRADLNRPFDLSRRFDLVLCLETVGHLAPESSPTIVDSLCAHSDRVIHPDMLAFGASAFLAENMAALEDGPVSWSWYAALPFKAAAAKLRRQVGGRRKA